MIRLYPSYDTVWYGISVITYTYKCFPRGEETILSLGGYPQTDAIEVFDQEKLKVWPLRDSNTQPSDLESDALPLRQGVLVIAAKILLYKKIKNWRKLTMKGNQWVSPFELKTTSWWPNIFRVWILRWGNLDLRWNLNPRFLVWLSEQLLLCFCIKSEWIQLGWTTTNEYCERSYQSKYGGKSFTVRPSIG